MSKTITLIVSGEPRQLEAEYLNPAALEYWHAWLGNEVRRAHNPFVELAEKIRVLPPELQKVVAQEIAAGLDFDEVPKLVVMQVARSLPAVATLCELVTGRNVVTEENCREAFVQLVPYIQRQEFTADSLEEVNRIRAAAGKPPLGKRTAGTAPAANSSAGSSSPAAAESPQGG